MRGVCVWWFVSLRRMVVARGEVFCDGNEFCYGMVAQWRLQLKCGRMRGCLRFGSWVVGGGRVEEAGRLKRGAVLLLMSRRGYVMSVVARAAGQLATSRDMETV